MKEIFCNTCMGKFPAVEMPKHCDMCGSQNIVCIADELEDMWHDDDIERYVCWINSIP